MLKGLANDDFISEKLTFTLKVNELTNYVSSAEPSQPEWRHAGPIVPIVSTFVGVIAWLLFILFYALFWSRGYSLFQNVIVTIVSLAIAGLLIGLMWMIWGTIHSRRSFMWTY